MPTKKRASRSLKSGRDRNSKMTPLGKRISEGLEELAAHLRGEITLRTRVIQVPSPVNVRKIRKQIGLSQVQFAERFGFNVRTLRDWEQNRALPDGPVRAYLMVIAKNPAAVEAALR